MLALERYEGESIVVGDPAKPIGTIHVVLVSDNKVRLAFDFPKNIQINRDELAKQKKASPLKGGL